MSAPLDFLRDFAARLRHGGIRFVITSGMACVHDGLQQTTKDSDHAAVKARTQLETLAALQPPMQELLP